MENTNVDDIIYQIKDLFISNKYDLVKMSQLVDKHLLATNDEKKNNAEYSTPYQLRDEMINKVPEVFWKTPKKVFEPSSGKYGFILDIIIKFTEGLKDLIEDEKERYRVILEDCLYFSDINPMNIEIVKLIIDPDNKYSLNYNIGNTLELNIKEKWNLEGFDLIIGNPPYDDGSGNKGKSHIRWDKFLIYSLKNLKERGYLVLVHPSLWRQIGHSLLDIMKTKQIHYLEIHNAADGNKTFKCATRYDWYLLENIQPYKDTIIKGEDGVIYELNIVEWQFIPNKCFEEIKSLISNNEETLDVWRYRSTYATEKKKLVSKTKNEEFKYPLINTINKYNELTLFYTNDNTKGHFNLSKFIFSNGAGFYKDFNGDYGLTEWSYCIYDSQDKLNLIEKAFRSKKFNNIKEALLLDSSTYNIKVMKLFRKDFYKDFL